ncbi:NAD(P)/FAD-dependent oxidoreductase [Almyronema epifaneia]|uniref:NAD(P)/FAD-dependent oxidoreductase n=1 Tax=Almyronema epifaneia S1 TaxID=2991925 RepID=A0ABW6I9X1_9CYAN
MDYQLSQRHPAAESAGLRATPSKPHICILGGGFGGLYTAVYLQKFRATRGDRVQITLIDRNERFLFTPLLYELITNELQTWEIAPTYQQLLAKTNVQFRQDTVQGFDLQARRVDLGTGAFLHYDYLVVATGSQARYVPVPGLQAHSLPFRTLIDAERLKMRLQELQQRSQPKLQLLIIGAGPSGVELACKLADQLGDRAHVVLADLGQQILTPFSDSLRRAASRALAQRGVEVLLETGAVQVEAQRTQLKQGDRLFWQPTDLLLWTAGTQPHPWMGYHPIAQNAQGQYLTRPTLQLQGYPEVFVVGDVATVQSKRGGPAPNTAQAAYQAADRVAKNLKAAITGKKLKPFHYSHLGDMLTLGIGSAVVDSSLGLTLTGKLAAIARRGVYTHRLPTWPHRLKVCGHLLRTGLRRLWQAMKRWRQWLKMT